MDKTLHQVGELLLGSIPAIVFLLLSFGLYRWLVYEPLSRMLEERYRNTEGAFEQAKGDIAAAGARTAGGRGGGCGARPRSCAPRCRTPTRGICRRGKDIWATRRGRRTSLPACSPRRRDGRTRDGRACSSSSRARVAAAGRKVLAPHRVRHGRRRERAGFPAGAPAARTGSFAHARHTQGISGDDRLRP